MSRRDAEASGAATEPEAARPGGARQDSLPALLVANALILALANAGAWDARDVLLLYWAESDGDWFVAYSPEIPGANGQGKTKEEARQSLADAIGLILEDRREDGLRGAPPDAMRETITVE